MAIKHHSNENFLDSNRLIFGTGLDASLYVHGDNLYIDQDTADKDIILRSDDGSGGITAYLTLDGSAVETKFNKDLRVIDNEKIIAGTSNDLEIFSSGADVIFKTWSGNMTFQQNHDDSDIIFQCDDGSGGVTAYLTLDGSAETVEVAKPLNVAGNLTASNVFLPSDSIISFDDSLDGSDQFITGTDNAITIVGDNRNNLRATTETRFQTLAASTYASIKPGGIFTAGDIELGHETDTTISRSAAGTVTIEGKTVATTNKTVAFFNSSFFNSSTSAFYAPFNYLFEQTSLSTASYFAMISAPYDGRVLKVSSRTQSSSNKTTTVEMYLNGDDSDLTNDQVGTDLVIGTYTSGGTGTCATDWVFSAGDALSFRITNSASGSGQVLTFVIEFDLDT